MTRKYSRKRSRTRRIRPKRSKRTRTTKRPRTKRMRTKRHYKQLGGVDGKKKKKKKVLDCLGCAGRGEKSTTRSRSRSPSHTRAPSVASVLSQGDGSREAADRKASPNYGRSPPGSKNRHRTNRPLGDPYHVSRGVGEGGPPRTYHSRGRVPY